MVSVVINAYVLCSCDLMHSQRSKRRKRSHKLKMSDDIDDETPIGGIRAPIVGYEVVDRREKFTV